MYSPLMYWGSRGELPQTSLFSNIEISLDKAVTLKEIYNLLPEEYKKGFHMTTSKGSFLSTKVNLGEGKVIDL